MGPQDEDVPTNVGFRWDGTTSDLAQQLYRRFEAGDSLPPLKHSTLPDSITLRLRKVGTTFDQLPGLLQRALVWDSGYVENAENPGELVRVQTLGGVSMADIAVPLQELRASNACTVKSCTAPGGETWYKSDVCESTQLLKTTRCMVDSFEGSQRPELALWSNGGNDTAIPAMRVVKHAWTEDATPYTIATIHTVEEGRELRADTCENDPSDLLLQGTGSLAIACESLDAVREASKSRMATPKPGAVVTAWLQQFSTSSATALSVNADAHVIRVVPIATSSPDADGSSTDMGLIIGVVSGIVVALLAGGLLLWWCRRPRAKAIETQVSVSRPQVYRTGPE